MSCPFPSILWVSYKTWCVSYSNRAQPEKSQKMDRSVSEPNCRIGKLCMYGFTLIVSSAWGVSAAVGRLQVVWVVPAKRGQELWSAFSTAVSLFSANRTHKRTHIHTLCCSYSLSSPIFKPITCLEPLLNTHVYTFLTRPVSFTG